MIREVSVVTGATGGIGRWIALGLARAGHHVVLVGRNPDKGQGTQAWIAGQVPGASTEVQSADLRLLRAARELGQTIAAAHPRVKVLVNNAGMFAARRTVTAEGREAVLALNHLAPYVLADALEPMLRAHGAARIVNVGSSTSDRARIDPADLELTRGWGFVRAYGRSKLALMVSTFARAERLRGAGVVANVVHPGAVATGLVRARGPIGWGWQAMAPFLLTEQQGADTPLHVALSPEWADRTGMYAKRRAPVRPNRRALDPVLAAEVDAATRRLVAETLQEPIAHRP